VRPSEEMFEGYTLKEDKVEEVLGSG